jgi:chemotaxis protein methyltransferase CheR
LDATLTRQEFKLFKEFVYNEAGISLGDHKMPLVQGRLAKRLRELGLKSYKEYYNYLQQNRDTELLTFLSAISTNVTHFFREPSQWKFLENNFEKFFGRKKKFRIWSAASSSGEEPYTIAIFLHENIKNIAQYDIKILATDISKKVLTMAQEGLYEDKQFGNLPNYIKNKYFTKEVDKARNRTLYRVKPFIKDMIMFRMFNLVYGDFSIFKKDFDVIFCRNVMIYFDNETRDALLQRFEKILDSDGLLFLGQSESTQRRDIFSLVGSSIYKKPTSRIF